jgi:hypothetical protein
MMIVYLDFFWPQRYWERGPVLILWQDYLFYGGILFVYMVFVFLFARVTLANLKERIFFVINPTLLFRSTPFAPGFKHFAKQQNKPTAKTDKKQVILSCAETLIGILLIMFGTIVGAFFVELLIARVFTTKFLLGSVFGAVTSLSFFVLLSVSFPYVFLSRLKKRTKQYIPRVNPHLIFYQTRIYTSIFVGLILIYMMIVSERCRFDNALLVLLDTVVLCMMVTLMMMDLKLPRKWPLGVCLTFFVGNLIYSVNGKILPGRYSPVFSLYSIRHLLAHLLLFSILFMIFIIIPYFYNKVYSQSVSEAELD